MNSQYANNRSIISKVNLSFHVRYIVSVLLILGSFSVSAMTVTCSDGNGLKPQTFDPATMPSFQDGEWTIHLSQVYEYVGKADGIQISASHPRYGFTNAEGLRKVLLNYADSRNATSFQIQCVEN